MDENQELLWRYGRDMHDFLCAEYPGIGPKTRVEKLPSYARDIGKVVYFAPSNIRHIDISTSALDLIRHESEISKIGDGTGAQWLVAYLPHIDVLYIDK